MIDKNIRLVDLTRLTEFKALCDKAYARKGEEKIDPSMLSESVTDDDVSEDEVLAIINATLESDD